MKLKVSGSDIKIIKRELIVSGNNTNYEFEFQFDKLWNDLDNKIAVFYQPSVNRDDPLIINIDSSNKVNLGSFQLVANDFLYIGVSGYSSDNPEIKFRTIFTYTYIKRGCS